MAVANAASPGYGCAGCRLRVRAQSGITTQISQATGGARATIEPPQIISWRKTLSRCSSGVLATTSAPEVENGLESTTELEMHSAMIMPTVPTSPASRNGTASGISVPRMPVVDANADTTPPM